jgi:Mn2+/Fe2+ NRAMP family transporter
MKSSFEELAANRAGRLAEGQREILERRIRSTRWFYLGFCALFLGLAVVFSVGIYSEIGGDDEILPVIIGMDVVIVLLTLPLLWRMRREIRKLRDDIAEGRVASYSGAITLGYKGQTLMLGNKRFPMPRSTRDIAWGETYTVYYAPRTGVIVAIEQQ